MRRLALPAIIVFGLLASAAAQGQGDDHGSRPVEQPPQIGSGAAAQAVDWADCLACHPEVQDGLPALSTFRINAPGIPLPDCRQCHEPAELTVPRGEWAHPVRGAAAHLSCTDCHVAVEHGADRPLTRPRSDYLADGCYQCHREIELRSSKLWSHGRDPRVTCRDCHPAHRPLQAALPLELLPREVRDNWLGHCDWWASNTACLTCHPPAALMMPLDAGFVTLNTTNYHDTHVVRGLVLCVECHDPHGSDRRGMLRDHLLTGEYFALLERLDGASCAVVCHDIDHQDWRYINSVF